MSPTVTLPRALVNDPSLTTVPGTDDLRMYVSVLSLDDVQHATERSVLWTARSTNGGATWAEAQLAIGQFNGLNSCGGWSPSALDERGQICVYYHGNSPCLGVYRTCFEPDGITLARPTRKLSLPLPLANIDVSFQEGRYVMVGDFLGLSNFLEIRALESTEGEIWRPLRGTVDGLLVRADEGIVFTPHVSWRDGNVMTLLFSTRSSLTNLEDKTTLHRWTISVPPARSDALSTMRVGPSVSGAPASGQQMVGTEARERDREGADDETELQYTDPPLALPPGDSLSAFEGDVPLGNSSRAMGDERKATTPRNHGRWPVAWTTDSRSQAVTGRACLSSLKQRLLEQDDARRAACGSSGGRWGWGRDALGTGARGRGVRALKLTTLWAWRPNTPDAAASRSASRPSRPARGAPRP